MATTTEGIIFPDIHQDIWRLVIKELAGTKQSGNRFLLPLASVSRRFSDLVLREIWAELPSFYPLLALFFDRDSSYADWEWDALAHTMRCLDTDGTDTGEMNTNPSRWDRFDYYAAHVRSLAFKIDGAYRNWSFLLPIKRLAATRPLAKNYSPLLLPNLKSITIELYYAPALDSAAAILTSPGIGLVGVESFAGLFLLIPPCLEHVNVVWTDNVVLERYTVSLTKYIRSISTPASKSDLDLGLVGSDYGFFDTPPGDYLTVVPRSASLVSVKGIPLSNGMLEFLAGVPCLSEISLYHMSHETIFARSDYETHLGASWKRFPCLVKLHILAFHNMYEGSCSALSHFPLGQLESLELEFTKAYKTPSPYATHSLFLLLGEHARALRAFSLVVDAERWDYSEPLWDLENDAYALAPWSSLSCLLSCHELRSLTVKCAGAYHGCVIPPESVRNLGKSWPYISKLSITEASIGVDAVKQSARPRVVDMLGMRELSRTCRSLVCLKLTVDVGSQPVGDYAVDMNEERMNTLPLDLDLGYSPLPRDDPSQVARELLFIWPGLHSIKTYWKDQRYGAHRIYLQQWRKVIEHCSSRVQDRHDTGRCRDGASEKAYWEAI